MNKDRIARLISFDDEGTDTSTGYVSAGSSDNIVWRRDPKEERETIKRAKDVYARDGYDQLVYIDRDGDYVFTRVYDGWYDSNSWDIIKVIAVVSTGYGRTPSVYKTYGKNKQDFFYLRSFLKTRGFPVDVVEELIDDSQEWTTRNS